MMSEIKSVRKPEGVTVTLCAIVKNETHIIREMLESMIPYIDRYDITDTGSDDGTPELIKEVMDEHNIPGEVYLSGRDLVRVALRRLKTAWVKRHMLG